MRSPAGASLLVLSLASALACALPADAGRRTADSGSGTIVFAADRLPLWYGEIYRIDLTGGRTDLSRNPALDVDPVVSPGGALVAFASDRGGRAALYVVRTDGTHLRRISPRLFSRANSPGVTAAIAWTAGGGRIAAALSGYGQAAALWIGSPGGKGRVVARQPVVDPVWSPDGGELAYEDAGAGEVEVISPGGNPLWRTLGDPGFPAWSATGRLAVRYHAEAIHVFDARGRRLASFRGRQFAWSPDGSELASVSGRRLQLRRAGVGAPTVDAQLLSPTAARYANREDPANDAIQWLGPGRLRVATGNGWVGFDLAAGQPWTLPPPFAAFQYPQAVSRDGSEVAVTSGGGISNPVTLSVATLAGSARPALQSAPPCGDASPFSSLQFTPDGRSLVYQSGCPEPSADIYSIGADGSDLRQLTDTTTDETQPSVSPDGTQIAFVRQLIGNRCEGCPTTIWTMNADGTNQRALTAPSPERDAWDARPTFSPDGRMIRFWHSTISSFGYLVDAPAAGGTQRRLRLAGGSPAWGPSRLAYVTGRGVIRTALPDGSDARTVATDPSVLSTTLAWSSQGRLAFLDAAQNGSLGLVVVAGSSTRRYPLGALMGAARGSGLAWSPDGTRLALCASDAAGVDDLYTVDADGNPPPAAHTRSRSDRPAELGLPVAGRA
jgi:Tol biopolymer transport system component